VQAFFTEKLHLTNVCEDLDDFAYKMFISGSFKKYKAVTGDTMKQKYFNKIVENVSRLLKYFCCMVSPVTAIYFLNDPEVNILYAKSSQSLQRLVRM
jgi:hypothetical protein